MESPIFNTQQRPNVIGINIGNAYSSVAIIELDGRPNVIANEDGERMIPTCVAFRGDEEFAGSQAQGQAVRNPKNTLYGFRDLLGQKADSEIFKAHQKTYPFTFIEKDGFAGYEVEFNGKAVQFTAHEITAKFLNSLKETASTYLGTEVSGAVLAVPEFFTQAQRDDLMTAARDAGLNVLQVINEPTAAVFAYDIIESKNMKADKTAVVLDLGARSLDVNLLSAKKGLYTVLATAHDNTIGGVNFDQLLVQHFSKEFQKNTKIDISSNSRALAKLAVGSEMTKRTLSTLISAPCFVESLAEGMDFHGTLNRTRFEIMSNKLFNQVVSVVASLLEKSDYKSYEVDEVILVGGASRIPKLARKLTELFAHDDFEVRSQLETDEVIPLGCVLQAATLSTLNHGEDVSLEQLKENSHLINVNYISAPIGLAGADDQFVTLVSKDTPLPVRRVFPLAIAEASTSAFVSIYEAVEDSKTYQPETPPQDPEDDEEPETPEPITTYFYKPNTLLAELGLKELSTPNLELQIEIDEQGKLDITLSDLKSGQFSQVTSA